MSCQGIVKSFSDTSGWGFVTLDGQDVFLHVKDCTDGRPAQGDVITFDIEKDQVKADRMKALNVTGCSQPADGSGKGMGKGKCVQGKGKGSGSGSHQGVVKSFNDNKGWGFITLDGVDIFLHVKDCLGNRPVQGDWLSFDLDDDSVRGPGQKKATNVSGGSGWANDGSAKGGGKDAMGKGMSYGPMWNQGWDAWGCGKGDWGMGPYGKGCGGDMMGGAWKGGGMKGDFSKGGW